MVESKQKVNDSMFSQFLMERAQEPQKRAPTPAQCHNTQHSKDRSTDQRPRPQTRAGVLSRNPAVKRRSCGLPGEPPELERGGVSPSRAGGREGDKVSSRAEPRGTSVRRERAHLPQPDPAEGARLHTTPHTRAPGTCGQLTLIHPRSRLQSGGSRGALGDAAVPGGAWKRCQLATVRTHTRRPRAERGRGR